ncbi:16110_t:CDS:10, partial [Acaulospora colombiana]
VLVVDQRYLAVTDYHNSLPESYPTTTSDIFGNGRYSVNKVTGDMDRWKSKRLAKFETRVCPSNKIGKWNGRIGVAFLCGHCLSPYFAKHTDRAICNSYRELVPKCRTLDNSMAAFQWPSESADQKVGISDTTSSLPLHSPCLWKSILSDSLISKNKSLQVVNSWNGGMVTSELSLTMQSSRFRTGQGPASWAESFLHIPSTSDYLARHPRNPNLSGMSDNLWEAASAAIQTLKNIGYTSACFVGSVASSLYGNSRYPKGLQTNKSTLNGELSTRTLLSTWFPPRNLLRPTKFFITGHLRHDPLIPLPRIMTTAHMDIVHTATLIQEPRSNNSRRLPAAPLSLTLLLKLQAWSQYRAAIEYHYSKEQYKDSSDLDQLVPIAERKHLKIKRDGQELPVDFVDEAQRRVTEYLQAYPSSPTRSGWIAMGFKAASFDLNPSNISINGFKDSKPHLSHDSQPMSNGFGHNHPLGDGQFYQEDPDEKPLPSMHELERELPVVMDGQVQLSLVMHQLVQDLYAQLLNIAETLGRASDVAKKTKLQQWLSLAYKQASKVYVLAKWSRNADDIQKAMNIAAFLRTQGEQIIWATKALHSVQDEAHRFRIRNPDLLTALDVLTTGTYTRLASIHQEFVKKKPLSNREVAEVFDQVEDIMRMRLICKDVVPVEMKQWRIEGGRTFFTVPQRFEVSLIMTGAQKDDVWAFVHVEFLFGLPDGDRKGTFSDSLAFQIRDIIMTPTIPTSQDPLTTIPSGSLTSAVVDAPLLIEFGWKECLRVKVALDRKSMTVQYWIKKPIIPPHPNPAILAAAKNAFSYGGELIISIVPKLSSNSAFTSSNQLQSSLMTPNTFTRPLGQFGRDSQQPAPSKSQTSGPSRTPIDKIKAEMQERLKLRGGGKPSDEVEEHRFDVQWRPQPGALGVLLPPSELDYEGLDIDSGCLDFEALLQKVLRRHADAIMSQHLEIARSSGLVSEFPHSGDVRQ